MVRDAVPERSVKLITRLSTTHRGSSERHWHPLAPIATVTPPKSGCTGGKGLCGFGVVGSGSPLSRMMPFASTILTWLPFAPCSMFLANAQDQRFEDAMALPLTVTAATFPFDRSRRLTVVPCP